MKLIKMIIVFLLAGALFSCKDSDIDENVQGMVLNKTYEKYYDEELKEPSKDIIFELGKLPSLNASEYLNSNHSEQFLENTSVNLYKFKDGKVGKKVDMKNTLPVGSYILILTNKEQKIELSILVKDTVAPKFVDFSNKLNYEVGEKVDLTKLFEVSDKSKVKVSVDGEVDFNKAGKYEVTFFATDSYGNVTKKKATVTISEKEVVKEEIKPEENKNEDTKQESSKQEVQKEEIKSEPSKKEEVKQEEVKQETSKQEEPKKEDTKQETPKQEDVKPEEPKEETSKEEPKQETSKEEKPSIEEEKKEEVKEEKPVTPSGYNTSYSNKAFDLINQERANGGLSQLPHKTDIQWLVDTRAKEVADEYKATGTISHEGKLKYDPDYNYGEIAAFTSGGGAPFVVHSWMNSTGHRAWIMRANEKVTGMASSCYYDADSELWFWIVIFSKY